MMGNEWTIFKGSVDPHNEIDRLLSIEAPSWRQFTKSNQQVASKEDAAYWQALQAIALKRSRDLLRGESFRIQPTQSNVLNAINAALYLRRPLLITGKPGSGKTSLAYAIARELKLGPVLVWAVTARSNLQQGLYQYDAIARLQDAQLSQTDDGKPKPDATELKPKQNYRDIGQYIRLGPVGTAFIPSNRPRVLMIDEVDKSDINLPNDLLNLLEEGRFEIPELRRLAKQGNQIQPVESEDSLEVSIQGGQVQCLEFPVVIMTSNGEREFPSAFLRRCVRVQMPSPEKDALVSIVKAHLGDTLTQQFEAVIDEFVERSEEEDGNLATDQLLNTLYLLTQNADEAAIKSLLFSTLSNLGAGQ
jgi:MoxR-like ATPase